MQVAAPYSRPKLAVANSGARRHLRVVVADGSSLATTVVLSLLEHNELMDLIGRAANFEETIQLVVNHQPDAVLIDLEMSLANVAIPVIILSSCSSVKIVGVCAGETFLLRHLDMIAMVNALVHKERLREEFATVMEALYSAGPFRTRVRRPKKCRRITNG
jgi:chemotaxis response regulator CheB